MTNPTAPLPSTDHAALAVGAQGTNAPRGAERFLLWVAGIGVARSEGWLGGVAVGIATRLRIDPLIVRGVLVVAALFGLPAIFLYAAAWAMLPDVDGRVHVRDLLRRDYQPVQWGILAMAVTGLFPTAPLTGRVFGLGYEGWAALSLISWIVGLVLVVGLLLLIVRAARRTTGASAPDLSTASADPTSSTGATLSTDAKTVTNTVTAPADTTTEVSSDTTTEVPAVDPVVAATPPAPPAPLPPDAQDAAALEAWRAQHAAWKDQHQAWRRQQQDAERAAREQLRRERQAAAAVFAAEAAERRRLRRAANPRAGFAFAATIVGLATITGAAVVLTTGGDALSGALGLLTAALILALGMIVAGAFRRRSGFLAFVTVLTLTGGLVAGAFSAFPGVTLGYASISNNAPAHVRQPFGDLYITLNPHDDGPRIVVDKGSGTTSIYVQPGVELALRATVDTATVSWIRVAAETNEIVDSGVWPVSERGGSPVSVTIAAEGAPTTTTIQPVTIHQASGEIAVTVVENAKEDQ